LYADTEDVETGGYRGALFTSKDLEPFYFLVAVKASGDEVQVAEAFFPDSESRERRLGEVLQALGGTP
jgi:hypothetical protein